ncbi:MAG: DinB family protein [Bacteroidota bacterium]
MNHNAKEDPQSLSLPILDAWERHNRILLYLIDYLPENGLDLAFGEKGKRIGSHFAHIHTVRRMWLQASAPELWEQTYAIDNKQLNYRPYIKEALNSSSAAICELLRMALENDRIKGFKLGPENFFAYLLSHESHHQGQIIMTLRLVGVELAEEIAFGLWDWGKR